MGINGMSQIAGPTAMQKAKANSTLCVEGARRQRDLPCKSWR
jgi:hypothetical protein